MPSNTPAAEHLLTVLSNVRTSPKWTFQGRHDDHHVDTNPGPGTYAAGVDGKHRSSEKWTFGSSVRETQRANGNPGPGTYEALNKPSSPSWTVTPRRDGSLYRNSTTPGPGTYNPALKSNGSPNFRFGSSVRPEMLASKTPGPGAYEAHHKLSQPTAPQWKMGTGNRGNINETNNNPGPGTYNLQDSNQAPKFSMASRHPDPSSHPNSIPGPGHYNVSSTIGKDSSSWTMRAKTPGESNLNSYPGPGHYTTSLHGARPSSPKWSFGHSQQRVALKANNGAAPGQYDPSFYNLHAAPRFGFGSSTRPPLNYPNANPGPGSYVNVDYRKGSNVKHTIAGRGERSRPLGSTPGPGQYEVRGGVASPQWGFGTSKRAGLTDGMNTTPGPGAYNAVVSSSAPKFSFRGKYGAGTGATQNSNIGPTFTQFGY